MNKNRQYAINALLLIGAFFYSGLVLSILQGQTTSGTISGGWRMPLMEENRMKTLLTGEGAKPLASGALEISKVKIQIFDDQNPPKTRMAIEAPQCVFDSGKKIATSAGPIALRATDGSFSIEGIGFIWDQAGGKLSISNSVRTIISRKALQSGKTEKKKKGQPIHVNADQFDYDKESNLGLYRGNVSAVEGERFKMGCDQLRVELPEGEDSPQSIAAEGNVQIELKTTKTLTKLNGDRAHYETSADDASLLLDGQPSWRSENYSGRGETIRITELNSTPIFTVSGSAFMLIPVPKSEDKKTDEQKISLRSDSYSVTETGAVFNGNVKVDSDANWNLASQRLVADIKKETQTITRILAEENVSIEQTVKGKKMTATGATAEFTPTGDVLSDALITGGATVVNDDFQSKAERIQFRRSELDTAIAADGNVTLILPRRSSTDTGFLGISTELESDQSATDNEEAQTIEIRADRYRLSSGTGRFDGNVTVTDSKGTLSSGVLDVEFGDSLRTIKSMTASRNVSVVNPNGELSCHHLEGQFAGTENRLERLIATDTVELRQVNGVATGAKAIFHVAQQLVELTGEPELLTRIVNGSVAQNVLTTADVLIWDQAENTFKARGKYRSRTLRQPK
jgi:lipopolysaccharide transport protein LptA